MRLEYQVIAALALDLILGDPRWLPHPVKLIGRCAAALEAPCRRLMPTPRAAGVATVVLVLSLTGVVTSSLVVGARLMHSVAGDIVSILLLYTTFAARDLVSHSMNVYHALKAGDLAEARRRVGLIVGRDTDRLEEGEVVRATVESVSENAVDGVTAPLFFALLGGPVGAMLYKAINTLDSTFGYKTEEHRDFGWASARTDDLATFVPARLTAPLVPVAATLLGAKPLQSVRVLLRDRSNHPSPNAGLTEAAVAGALGVQLGGLSYYASQPSEKPALGDPIMPLERRHILQANALMVATYILAALLFISGRLALLSLV